MDRAAEDTNENRVTGFGEYWNFDIRLLFREQCAKTENDNLLGLDRAAKICLSATSTSAQCAGSIALLLAGILRPVHSRIERSIPQIFVVLDLCCLSYVLLKLGRFSSVVRSQ